VTFIDQSDTITNKRTMAEASKGAKRKRESRLNIPLTEEEKREVRIRAAREDKAMTEYVREILFSEEDAVPA
jgi:hypothetical protein